MKTIREVMSPDPIQVHPETPLREAIALLVEHNISGVPVVDGDQAIVGILSEKDLLKLFHEPDARAVGALMTRDPITFPVDADLVEVVDCLLANDFRRVMIHDAGRLVGLVSRADVMPAILDLLGERSP